MGSVTRTLDARIRPDYSVRMANYVNVTQEDMEELLLPQGFRKLDLDGVRELVYGKRVDRDGLTLTMRVFTGIDPDGNSRDCGSDAMRVNLFWRRPDEKIVNIAGSKRVHRVAGWKGNLQQRIDTLVPGPCCPTCSSPMVERKGKNGKFYGCSDFPNCRGTRAI